MYIPMFNLELMFAISIIFASFTFVMGCIMNVINERVRVYNHLKKKSNEEIISIFETLRLIK